MSNSRSIVRPLVFALCVGVTIAGLLNVYGDNHEVVGKAETAACGGAACAVTMTRAERSAISQSFTFQTRLVEKGRRDDGASVDVVCQRAFWLVGEYTCTRQGDPSGPTQ
jgi:hypothetical protein